MGGGRLFGGFFVRSHSDKRLFEELEGLVVRLRATGSVNAKVELLRQKPELLPLLHRVYSPLVRFHISSKALKGQNDSASSPAATSSQNEAITLDRLLSLLTERAVTGNAAHDAVIAFLARYPEHDALIKAILDKNLKARIGTELIHRAMRGGETPDEKPPCALGFSIDHDGCREHLERSLARNEAWYMSRKYDGIRAFLCYNVHEGTVQILSRRRVPIAGLNPTVMEELQRDMERIGQSCMLDGELVVFDESDRDDFSLTVSTVKSLKPKPIGRLKFMAFDAIHNHGEDAFSARQTRLRQLLGERELQMVRVVEQRRMEHVDRDTLVRTIVESDFEGFILRRDVPLWDGRSRDLLKLKPFADDEFRVTGHEVGPMRTLVDGQEREETLLLSVSVTHHGTTVKVGSGFSVEERRRFARDPSLIVGQIITVQYQSESKSLRFPVFKALHGANRTE